MKTFVLSLLLTATCILSAAPKLVFSSGFENGSAGIAADGREIASAIRKDSESNRASGISGYGALVNPQNPLTYPASGLVNPMKGSLSFWIKPLDWEAGCKEFRPIFWLGGSGAHRVSYYLLLTGNGGLPQATFFTRLSGKELAAQYDIHDKEKFARDKWTFVTLNWNAWQVELFLNGKTAALLSYSLPANEQPLSPGVNLWFGNHSFWGKNYNYSSVFDEIRLYDDILTPQEIEAEYLRHTAKVSASAVPHRANVPKRQAAVKVDGAASPGEWDNATQIPLNKEFFTGNMVPEKSFLSFQHDRDNVYFLFETDAFAQPGAAKKFERSMKAFSQDVFEVILRSGKASEHTEPFIQIGISPGGCWAMQNGGNWNVKTHVDFAVSCVDGVTRIEAALPLREVDPSFQDGKLWQAEFGYTVQSNPSIPSAQDRIRAWVHVRGDGLQRYSVMYHHPEVMGELKFSGGPENFRVESFGNLLYGDPSFKVGASEKIPVSFLLRNQGGDLFSRTLTVDGTAVCQGKVSSVMPVVCSIQAGGAASPLFFYEVNVQLREQLQLQTEIFPGRSVIQVGVDASGLPEKELRKLSGKGLAGTVVFYPEGHPEAASGKTEFVLNSIRQTVPLSFGRISRGPYTLAVTLDAPSGKIEKKVSVEVPEDDFLRETRGSERKVFPPWTPVKASSPENISVIGRDYTFGPLGWLQTARAWDEEVLASPVEFIVKQNGRRIAFHPVGKIETLEDMPDRVVHSGVAASEDGKVRLLWKRTVEFDGMVLYRIELPAGEKESLELDGLSLRFGVAGNSSRYLMAPEHIPGWDKNHRAAFPNQSFYWLSGLRSGLDFFLPDDGNWVTPGIANPVTFRRSGPGSVAEADCTILSRPVKVTRPLVYNFGFLATPAKPLRDDWRKLHVNSWGTARGQMLQDYWCFNEKTQHLVFPNKCLLSEVVSEKGAREEVADWHAKGIKLVPMSLHTQMPDNNRFYDFYGAEWRITQNGVPGGKSFRSKWLGKEFYMCSPVCPNSSYAKFLNWCVANLMLKYGVDGVYLDGSQTGSCDNPLHGCGFKDAFGRDITPRNDLACRESFRRLYQTIHGIKPDGFLFTHANIRNAPHVHSMSDLILPGEELMPAIFGHPNMYTDDLALERWQSSYNVAKLLGTPAVFLGLSQPLDWPLNKAPKDLRVSDPLIAMCLVHDINLWGNFIYCKTIERVWKMLDDSGISAPGTVFTGYWQPGCPVRSDNPKLLVSCYAFPGTERLVAVIANRSAAEQSGKLILPEKFAGLETSEVRDLYNDRKLDVSNGVRVMARGFLVLELVKGK